MIELASGPNPLRSSLAVTSSVCVGAPDAQFLFGGAGLAACIAALESATGRPAVWVAAQYLSYARPPSRLDLEVIVPVTGKHSSQARVVGRVGDTEILTVNAALGSRPETLALQWPVAPPAPPPEECPDMTDGWQRAADDIRSRIDLRVVRGRYGPARAEGGPSLDGHSVLWARLCDPSVPVDRVALAVLADFLPSGIGHAIGAMAGGNSLDNTIRYARVVPTEWVLLDTRIHAVANGFGHGRMHLFAEDGTLMATASQSVIVRL